MAGAPKGNKNAEKHGFYSQALLPGEEEFFEQAKTLPIDEEIALLRTRARRAVLAEASGTEIPEGTQAHVDRTLGRLRDFMMAKSIMLRNDRETGADTEDDPASMVATIQRHGAHRTTFKNGKGNGRSNGSS